ncbi:MAG: sigma-54-dependent Fis family transcriptional regulator [Planctomycetaceae bacterium]|nr:sigma-54-dependent Fis family transcriptional regulator [Planctomycetaceae bacterium]
MTPSRPQIIVAAFALVVVFVCGVAARLVVTPDIGIYCLVTAEPWPVATPPGAPIGWVDLPPSEQPLPHGGDRLLTVDGRPVPTIVHFQKVLEDLSRGGNAAAADLDRTIEITFARHNTSGQVDELRATVPVRRTPLRTLSASAAWLALQFVILAIGATVFWRRAGDVSAALFFALCVVTVIAFIGTFHWPYVVTAPLLLVPYVICGILQPPLTLHFHALFPRPLGIFRVRPLAAGTAIYLLPALWLAAVFFTAYRIFQLHTVPARLDELRGALQAMAWLSWSYWGVCGATFITGLVILRHKYLHGRTVAERNQVRWLLATSLVASVPLGYLLQIAWQDRGQFAFGPGPKLVLYLTSLLFAICYAISITRHRLWLVGQLVHRELLHTLARGGVSLLFAATVGIVIAIVVGIYFRWQDAVAIGLTALFAVIAVGWIHDRAQQWLDRRFRRERRPFDKALEHLSEALGQVVEPAQIARQLVQSMREVLGIERAAVYLLGADGRWTLAYRQSWPQLSEQLGNLEELSSLKARIEPLDIDGQRLGVLLCGRRPDERPLTTDELAVIAALCRSTTLALHGMRHARAVEQLREELADKRRQAREQRRRISFLQSELLAQRIGNESIGTSTPSPSELRHTLRGSSRGMRALIEQIGKVAASPSSVLIRGESGTGKELIARAIHENSVRAAKPFVQVHCAALSAGLLESELFGHVKGAFTGADRDRAGRFELADGGTLFLDEIGDISLETQTKLLRVLQERAFERVGGTRTIAVDVRLIAATHQNLEQLIRAGRFREDLLYRLNVISLHAPALRDRQDDIFELAMYFLRIYSARAAKLITRIDDDAIEALTHYHWPGNVRQLENVIERAVVLAEGETIGRDDLPLEVLQSSRPRDSHAAAPTIMPERLFDDLAAVERERLVTVLADCRGNKSEAARLLGIPRSTLFSKLRRFGLK